MRAALAVLLGLHVVSTRLPIEHVWGVGGFPAVPAWARAVLVAAVVVALLPGVSLRLRLSGARAWPLLERRAGTLTLAGVAGVLFWVGRLRHLRWGDAYIFVQAIAHPEYRLTYNWQAPLDVFVHAKAWALAHRLFGWDVQTVYAVLSCLAGVVYVILALSLARSLAQHPAGRFWAAGLLLTLGSVQLFCGYVESYTIIPVGIMCFLLVGLRRLHGTGSLWAPSLALAITIAFSPSALPVGAGLAYLTLRRCLRLRNARPLVESVTPLVAVGVGVVMLMECGGHGLHSLFGEDFPGGADRSWFVPLSEPKGPWQHYTMFSWAHFRDVLNEQLLVAPVSLLAILWSLAFFRKAPDTNRAATVFLGLCAVAYLALTFVWNPDYGGRRDWDLFAPASFPLTAFALHLLMSRVPRSARATALPALVVFSAAHLIPWVYFNTRPWPWD